MDNHIEDEAETAGGLGRVVYRNIWVVLKIMEPFRL